MYNKEHNKFDSPRYKLTWIGNGYRSYLDLETGKGCCYIEPDNRSIINHEHYDKICTVGDRDKTSSKDTENTNYICGLPIVFDKEIKLIVGVTIGGILPDWVGAHAFVMYINEPYNLTRNSNNRIWQEDIMLDASGQYGIGLDGFRNINSDIVHPQNMNTISIDYYRKWFHQRESETLYTYTYLIEKDSGSHIRGLILEHDEVRTSLRCATKASRLLLQSSLFQGVRVHQWPAILKRFLDNYTPVNRNIMILEETNSYDLSKPPAYRPQI
jgi:hypothetical protein